MADSYITLVSIQPSGSVKLEDENIRADRSRNMKQGMYPERRQHTTDASALSNGPPILSPRLLTATPGIMQAMLSWPAIAGATGFNVYWSTTPGVTKQSAKLSNITSGFLHTGLSPWTRYYYALTVMSPAGEGPLGSEQICDVQGLPRDVVAPMLAPLLYPVSSSQQVPNYTDFITFGSADARATSFNLYWSSTPVVTKQSNKIAGIQNPYSRVLPLPQLSAWYAVTAVGPSGESDLSNIVSIIAPLTINSATTTTPPRGAIAFMAAGGEYGAYTWSFATNNSGGTIDQSGNYVAGSTGSVTDVIQVRDSVGTVTTASITVTAVVSITPAVMTLRPGAQLQFSCSGGSGTGYVWQVSPNASGASVDSTGLYTAGAMPATDTLRVTDSLGNVATVPITVASVVRLIPTDASETSHVSFDGASLVDLEVGAGWVLNGAAQTMNPAEVVFNKLVYSAGPFTTGWKTPSNTDIFDVSGDFYMTFVLTGAPSTEQLIFQNGAWATYGYYFSYKGSAGGWLFVQASNIAYSGLKPVDGNTPYVVSVGRAGASSIFIKLNNQACYTAAYLHPGVASGYATYLANGWGGKLYEFRFVPATPSVALFDALHTAILS